MADSQDSRGSITDRMRAAARRAAVALPRAVQPVQTPYGTLPGAVADYVSARNRARMEKNHPGQPEDVQRQLDAADQSMKDIEFQKRQALVDAAADRLRVQMGLPSYQQWVNAAGELPGVRRVGELVKQVHKASEPVVDPGSLAEPAPEPADSARVRQPETFQRNDESREMKTFQRDRFERPMKTFQRDVPADYPLTTDESKQAAEQYDADLQKQRLTEAQGTVDAETAAKAMEALKKKRDLQSGN